MEPSRFDELTKALATATSRRHALKALAATVGGLLSLGSIGTAFANCKPNGIGCNTRTQCCSGQCQHGACCTSQEGATCSADRDCCSGNCSNGICCGSGQVGLCNGSCATPCAAPHTACPDGSLCSPDNGANYCGGFLESNPICGSDCDCPRGMFCSTDIGTCAFVS